MDETPSKQPVGVIGLGYLGTALAERLLGAGYSVVVNNRTREKADRLLARGAEWSDNPLAVCGRVVISLYTTDIVEDVLQKMESGIRPGQILLDTTTGDPVQTASLGAKLADRGVDYLESPIAASSEQTRRGEAIAIVGGPPHAFDACQDLFDCMAAKSFLVGSWGSAAKTKLVNNLVLGLTRAALAEGLVFAKAIGLETAKTLDILKQGNCYSVVMDVKGKKMLEEDYSVEAKLSQHKKDVRLILEEGKAAGAALPLSKFHHTLLEKAEKLGLGELDNSAILRAIELDQGD